MASLSEDVLTQITTEGATDFVQSFYNALQSSRNSISSFYTPSSAGPTILFNGNTVADGVSVQDIFVNQMPPAFYEVQSVDCQILNENFPTPTPPAMNGATGGKAAARNATRTMSMLVLVSGYVRYGESREAPQRGFSETFMLVPNSTVQEAAAGARGRAGRKDFLIQSQNFRLVV